MKTDRNKEKIMGQPLEEWDGDTWRTWLAAAEDLDWDPREAGGAALPVGVVQLIELNSTRQDPVMIRAAVESLATVMEEWSLPRMALHVNNLQVTYKDFGDFGYERRKEDLADVPDDVLVKDADGRVDYDAIGAYYVRSADLVHTGADGRVFFFLRPGCEGQSR